jgi:hypothetical protein
MHHTSSSWRFFFDEGDDDGDGCTTADATLITATLAGDTVVPAPDTAAAACSFTFANVDGACTFRRFFLSPRTATPDVTAKPVIVVFDDVDDVTDVLANPSTAARTSAHTHNAITNTVLTQCTRDSTVDTPVKTHVNSTPHVRPTPQSNDEAHI